MRKALAITLLGVFLFQLVGYYFVYLGLRAQASKDLLSRLDAHQYAEDETITLKIPFSLPYWNDSEDYERVNGDFEYKGQFYKLVKQKLSKDTLYVVCIRSVGETQLFDAITDYIKMSNDVPATSKQALKLWGSIVKDYLPVLTAEIKSATGWSLGLEVAIAGAPALITQVTSIESPPPEA